LGGIALLLDAAPLLLRSRGCWPFCFWRLPLQGFCKEADMAVRSFLCYQMESMEREDMKALRKAQRAKPKRYALIARPEQPKAELGAPASDGVDVLRSMADYQRRHQAQRRADDGH
jgi:hypothetical protein